VRPALELALETSRPPGSVAVARGERVLAATLAGERAHASDLLPLLERLLLELGAERRAGVLELARVFVGTGPGSYTGLRVGLATAQGLCRATGARLQGVSSFEALAWSALRPGEEGTVLLDARGGRIYHGRYRRTAGDVEVRDAPRALTAAELQPCLAAPGPILGHPELAQAIVLAPEAAARLRTDVGPEAGAVLALGRRRATGPDDLVEPQYLREFGQR